MATRMQQRRGTAAQWTAANPTLAAGEIGFETDTNQFKIGNGSSAWSALSYFKNLDGLDGVGGIVTLNAQGVIDLALIPQGVALDAELTQYVEDHNDETENVHGISNTANLVYQTDLTTTVNNAIDIEENNRDNAISSAITDEVSNRNTAITTAISAEVADRDSAIDDAITQEVTDRNAAISAAISAEVADRDSAIDDAITQEVTDRNNAIGTQIGTHNSDTTDVHGITDTAALATKTYADNAASAVGSSASANLTAHNTATTNVHGIADTAALATKTYADNAVSTHEADTTNVHGITNTANLVTLAGTQTLTNKTLTAPAITSPTGLVKADVGLGNVDNTSDANKPVSTATQSALDLKAPLASPTFTGTVSGITKSMVGLGNVDNTSDANKPVSTATQSALDLKANLASPTFTGVPAAPTATAGTNTTQVATTAFVKTAVDNVIASAPGALDTLNELAAALGNDANYASTITSALALKAPLASPTFTGTVTLPTGTVTSTMILDGTIVDGDISASAAIAQSKVSGLTSDLAAKAPLASPTFTGTVTLPAAGIVFSDGTQSKEGVPSRTSIIQKSAAYTLSALSERDSMIEVSHTGGTAVDITIPANSSVAYPVGTSIDILRTNTGKVRIVGAAGVTVNATPGAFLRDQWSAATLFKRATDTWVLIGDLATA